MINCLPTARLICPGCCTPSTANMRGALGLQQKQAQASIHCSSSNQPQSHRCTAARQCTSICSTVVRPVSSSVQRGVPMIAASSSQAAAAAALAEAAETPAAAGAAATAAEAAAPALPACQPRDILRAVAADGSELFLEVVNSSNSSSSDSGRSSLSSSANSISSGTSSSSSSGHTSAGLTVAHQGVTYTLTCAAAAAAAAAADADADAHALQASAPSTSSSSGSSGDASASNGSAELKQQSPPGSAAEPVKTQQAQQTGLLQQTPWLLQPTGWLLQPDSSLVKSLPGWPAALQQQQARQQLPQQPLLLQSVAVVYSAAALQAAVQQNPALWRDGTGPSDPPLKGLQYQTLAAGELEALLCGARGVAMLQLWVGWDAAAPQPLYNPLVLHSLQRALGRKDISIFMSNAPGGFGLTAILTAAVEPFRSWGRHLASFGAQAALVADSPFYKLLIGRMLGYAEPNIRHHIQATTGRPVSPEVVAAVDKELRSLSKQKPKLPWKATGAAAAAGAGAGASSNSGSGSPKQPPQQQQQLSRSARKKQRK